MIVMNQAKDKVLLIKQYGRDSYILVAGYVNKGEDSEATCRRELKEELNLDLKSLSFNRSSYFAPSNVLMLNYTVVVDEDQLVTPNEEVDAWDWLSVDQARKQIRPKSLAEEFLDEYLDKLYESN